MITAVIVENRPVAQVVRVRGVPLVGVRAVGRHGAVIPQPAKRPNSSYIRFAAAQPNQCWQSDFTHHRLAGGQHVEIITWLDDHSRYRPPKIYAKRLDGTDAANRQRVQAAWGHRLS